MNSGTMSSRISTTRMTIDRPQVTPLDAPNGTASTAWMCTITHATASNSGLRMLTLDNSLGPGRHGVVSAGVEGMAPGEPPHRQPQSPHRAVHPQRLQRVLAARGREPAPRGEQRADEPPVAGHGHHKHARGRRCGTAASAELGLRLLAHWRSAPTCRRSSRPSTRSRSAARSAWRAPAAAGWARTTSRQPPGSEASRLRISSRSRRFTRLRTTAEPTARLTTKPTFGRASSGTETRRRTEQVPGRAAAPPARRPERIDAPELLRGSSSATAAAARALLLAEACSPARQPRWSDGRRCSRPLRRRAARTARPARVRMRSRKPWVLARRRLFGWNVRLLTGTPGTVRNSSVPHQRRTCRASRGQAQV